MPVNTDDDHVMRGAAYAVAATLCFVCMDTLAKSGGQFLSVPMLVWGRYTFHLAVLVCLIPVVGVGNVIKTRQPKRHLIRGLCLAGATSGAYTAVQFMPLVDLYAIGFTVPLLVTILAIPVLGETVGMRRWFAVFVGFLGVMVVVRPGLTEFNIGMGFAFGMAIAFALYQILTRGADRADGPFVGLFYAAIMGTAGASVVVAFGWEPPSLLGWAVLVFLGLFGAVGHLMLIMALRSAPASFVSPITYVQIIWAIIVGFIVFNNVPDPFTMLGASIVMGAGIFVLWRERVVARRKA